MTLPRAFTDGMRYLALHCKFWEIYTALHNREPVPAAVIQPVLGPALDDTLVSLSPAVPPPWNSPRSPT